jgi:hypothetical protein
MNEFDPHTDSNDPLKDFFKDNAMERAPESLVEDIMSTIATESVVKASDPPLISLRGWVLIGLSLLLLSVLPFALPENPTETSSLWTPISQWFAQIQFPGIELPDLSNTFITGVFAFGLFGLLHLYWLKRQLDKRQLV